MKIRDIDVRSIIGRVYSNILSLLQPTSLYLGHVIAFPVFQSYFDMETGLDRKKYIMIILSCQLKLEFHA